jgi:hypothetical protein
MPGYAAFFTIPKEPLVGIGTSIVLIAVGAILKYAVTASISGIRLDTVGTILLVIGILGLVISLLYTAVWSDRDRGVRRERVIEDDVPPAPRDRYR